MDWNIVIALTAVVLTMFGGQWKLFNSIDSKFSEIKKIVYSIKDEVSQKLEYHERHDDKRFSEMTDNIWMLRLRNAAKDGIMIPPSKAEKEQENKND